jgi:separase
MLEHADSQPTTPTHRQINGDINSRPGFLVAVSKLLESVLSCLVKTLSVADLSANGKQSKSIVESYIVLARASLSQPIRLPSRETYDHLHDAVKFVEHLPLSSPVLAECGRLLSLVHWTFGTALYGNDQIAAAVPYLEVSCRVGEQALRMLQLGATPQTSPEIRTLEDQISKRWELLGFCEARTGDFRVGAIFP